jgi:hypothetical protein
MQIPQNVVSNDERPESDDEVEFSQPAGAYMRDYILQETKEYYEAQEKRLNYINVS